MSDKVIIALVSGFIGMLLGVIAFNDTEVGIIPILPCDMERTSENAEDDLCTMWKVTENKWAIGPMSERP